MKLPSSQSSPVGGSVGLTIADEPATVDAACLKHAISDKWTEHAAESEEVSEMKKELERQRAQISFSTGTD